MTDLREYPALRGLTEPDDLPPVDAYAEFEPSTSVVPAAGAGDTLPEPVPTVDFPRVSISDIFSAPSPEPAFIWAGRIPRGHVTLLGAHGGVGKSMLALQLAVAVCLGVDFLGARTKQGRVLFFSGEDGGPVLRHRLGSICAHFGASPHRLAKSLTILDASDEPALYREVSAFGIRTGEPTPGFNRLSEIIREVQPDLVIVDNASDVFEASENDRASVRGFMRQLRQLFPDGSEPPAMLLLAHIQKAATAGRHAESYSGSTAWHNSARSRLALTADRDDATRLTLSHDKNNLGARLAEPLRLVRSMTGLLMVDESKHDASGEPTEPPVDALLKVLADFVERGERVATESSAHTNAWKLCRPEPGFPKRAFPVAGPLFSAIRQMERDGLIEKESYRDSYRKDRTAWTLTAPGWERIGKSAPSASSASSYGENAENAVSLGGAPSAPSYGVGGMGDIARADEGANPPDSPLAEKSACPRCDGEGCEFCQPKDEI
ncbi:AAA family ATPase [Acidithiobacillus ferriphilus]|uniref:AAA family ATPase n=1 Tax=Acidithiobacillus ferriphilus TaxID=1689834 RepID=UPI001C06235A|nr:AAA family ATPase [Acidithiobacillus ferriphilus]MBU2784851.1 AAA family ATPase [Acidithiobacillus ferriphilus]